jgi:hypothetical protein
MLKLQPPDEFYKPSDVQIYGGTVDEAVSFAILWAAFNQGVIYPEKYLEGGRVGVINDNHCLFVSLEVMAQVRTRIGKSN